MNIGEFCRGCGQAVTMKRGTDLPQGIIDCIDNSGDHTNLNNLQLLCKACNMIKNPRRDAPSTTMQMSFSQKKNMLIEPQFRAYVIRKVADSGGSYSVDAVTKGGAEKYGFSIKTAGDYLAKLTSEEGPMYEEEGIIYWKDNQDIDKWVKDGVQRKVPAE